MKSKLYIAAIILLISSSSIAQRIDNTASFRDIKNDRYFRFDYDNDFFTSSDLYYTQGYTLELVTPWLKGNPINKILIAPKTSEKRYGLSFEQTGFIPTDISADQILYGDRPYAATIALKSFVIATDTLNKSRLSSSLTSGMIGPAALGDQMQSGIHKWIGDELPMGWKYQMKNDLILDYELVYEKQLYQLQNIFRINLDSKARLGTYNTHISAGINATLGIINSPFTSFKDQNRFQVYLFTQPQIKVVGYDASIQGGLFSTNNPYTISAGGIERFVMQNNYGIVIRFKKLYFEYSRADITREFKTGYAHKWGGFKIGFHI
ncbi:lipid A deacylase LpxR family protein [Flavobacterium cerinum]|uniref:Lipid A deacylase LpxR family protein n=1 Tax=Flavobacterium cerinum TaxID=2502784 RepID=A0A3S3TSU5_9FLAO|nr:lipid A deacylase LpxR family protein [Flavobacterium cerinum]RWW92022.1 lipid A deacylase LpxR family protein [Flavobacterium cerinum]